MGIKENLKIVQEQIAEYSEKAGVNPGSVELVAVSKTIEAPKIQQAYDAGQRMFGENKVQEFVEKSEKFEKDVKWNLIGRLQTNKVKYIMNHNVFLVHSLDRIGLAEELQKQGEKTNNMTDALIQLNIAEEETKSGLLTGEVDGFLEKVTQMDKIRLKGIMTIGPNTDDEMAIRRVFAKTKQIYDRLCAQMPSFEYLSMGMSHDFGLAILEGSNMVRVGTAIFGQRDYTNIP
ncbi:YggS family pyridoxal phosphate-dependent enzyme [Christensenellaceae bacterium OttesenSCG-928-K19]|nr:YggS family pyridoxal phosphate-dependent enzyme [Christensenellaceae bacterium OttesenSCG-928-K19]